jgi:septum formation protein
LRLLVTPDRIDCVPPRDSSEAGFERLHELPAIERRITEIARTKADDVAGQMREAALPPATGRPPILVAADTVIVAGDWAGCLHVLGQPPADDDWQSTVRGWFREFYAGRTHAVITALCVRQGTREFKSLVRSEVTMTADVDRYLDWYLATGEPQGKAGGYAIQGAGSLFVTNFSGSLSNIIGLPLEALREILGRLSGEL